MQAGITKGFKFGNKNIVDIYVCASICVCEGISARRATIYVCLSRHVLHSMRNNTDLNVDWYIVYMWSVIEQPAWMKPSTANVTQRTRGNLLAHVIRDTWNVAN